MKILVTGCAGFVGSNLVDRLLLGGYEVIGIDNFNDYYDPNIKERNLRKVLGNKNFKLYRDDILDLPKMVNIFKRERPEKIIHLAARAGVRPSIVNPILYSQVNVLGTVNLLKLSIDFGVSQFIFGSSSSVYGNSKKLPFSEDDKCESIISPYGASKRSAEFFVEVFAKMSSMKCLILRFFTVYGPRGRPDMAPALFANSIEKGKIINQFGDGSSSRDYTFIDDIVDGIIKSLNSKVSFAIVNLGNNTPVTLDDFIKSLEKIIAKKARIQKLPEVVGDAPKTWANIEVAQKLLKWSPKTTLLAGLKAYIKWRRAEN